MHTNKVTPVLLVDRIEPCLPLWEGLGWKRTTEVPEGDALGFVILEQGGHEVMYQSRASVFKDVPQLADYDKPAGHGLFIEVDELAQVEANLEDAEIVVPRRTTFYGSHEVIVKDAAGHVITFAEFPRAD